MRTSRQLAPAVSALALAVGAVLYGGILAAVATLLGAVAAGVVALRPGWTAGQGLVAVSLVLQDAAAPQPSGWRSAVTALLLAAVLAAGEVSGSSAWAVPWRASVRLHGRAVVAGFAGFVVIEILSLLGASAALPTATAVLIGVGLGAALVVMDLLGRDIG